MSLVINQQVQTQNELLLQNLEKFYQITDNLYKMMQIINGESRISLRIIDWFSTNFSKKYYTIYELPIKGENGEHQTTVRFKVHNEYKLKLKSYSKKKFDVFCRHTRIKILYDKEKSLHFETTIGQICFFKWAIENRVLDYIDTHYDEILDDMNERNSTSKNRDSIIEGGTGTGTGTETQGNNKTRKKRQELSVSALKSIKKEHVQIIVKFD